MVTESRSAPVYIDDEHDKSTTMNHHSSILGAAIGDISGSSRESAHRNIFRTNFKLFVQSSTITDDTVLSMAVAEWLLCRDHLTIADALRKWGQIYPNAGYGRGFRHFLRTGESAGTQSNGAAMRVSPVGEWAKSLDEALDIAKESAIVTHGGGGVTGAQAIAAAVFLAKNGIAQGRTVDAVKAEIKSFITTRFSYNLDLSLAQIRARCRKSAEQREQYKASGTCPEGYVSTTDASLSCSMAITAALLGQDYEETVRLAISMGGDSDTVGGMAGGIAAQLYGIPDELAQHALVFLPAEMIAVINAFEGSSFQPTGISPSRISRWTAEGECVVYGAAPEGEVSEDGWFETIPTRYSPNPHSGYAIPTIGKSLPEIKAGVDAFIAHAQAHPEMRFHVRKVGYHKAGYTVAQIAPLFAPAVGMPNVLLPAELLAAIKKEGALFFSLHGFWTPLQSVA